MLSRLAYRPLIIRPFSTTAQALQEPKNRFANDAPAEQKEPVRRNPLVGNYTPAKPTKPPANKTPPASTEKPWASRMPSPSKAPVSSAEVPPNADMPPPPPPPPPASTSAASKPNKPATPKGGYDATAPAQSPGYIDIARLLDNSANRYAKENNLPASPLDQPLVRTKPVTGRTVFPRRDAGGAVDAAALFQNLERTLAKQKVKSLMHRQKFHERPGMKRKRLVMERWRKRFKVGFKATTQRVMELKRQGW